MTDAAFAEIPARLQLYFDGLYYGDTARLAEIFHPEARYVSATDEHFVPLTMPDYFQRVENRPRPSDRNDPRADAIQAITLAGPHAALAVVTCRLGSRQFIDLLTLVRWGGSWRIMAKVFHYDELSTPN